MRRSSFWRREWLKVVAAAALGQISLSPLSGAEGLPPAALAASASDAGIDKLRFELGQARAAKKQATDDKARAYLTAHQLFKKCDRELRPFCMMSAQMMIRNADARFKNRERHEFPDIRSLEAAVAGRNGAPPGPDNCGTAVCLKSSQ